MRIIFMGTPEFAVAPLQKLTQSHEIVCVYTQPPRPAGKGLKDLPSAVHVAANKMGIPVRTPVSLRDETAQADFKALSADVAVVCAYGLLLPQAILAGTKYGCVNIHASLLPRWRGAAPIQRAIQAGDSHSGITIMQMDKGLDTGDMLAQEQVEITPDTTGEVLHDQLMEMGAEMISKVVDNLPISGIKQPETGMTYAKKIEKEESKIDWNQSAMQLERTIRAFNPYPACYFLYNGERIKVYKACVVPEKTAAPAGTVLDDNLTIACKDGALRLLELQRAGKKVMTADNFLKGNTLLKGTLL